MNHTPTPWKLENTRPNNPKSDEDNRCLVVPADPSLGACIATMQYTGKEEHKIIAYHNAKFIVTACNAHEDLVKALEGLMKYYVGNRSSKNVVGESGLAADFAREALAKAGVK